MQLFTKKETENLEQLMVRAVEPDQSLSLESLHGLLFALAIIPEPISPSEWLPLVFGEEMIEVEDEREGKHLLGFLFCAYNRLLDEETHGELVFPFDMDKIEADDLDRIRHWAYGFFLGLGLRPDVWGMPEAKEFEEEEPLAGRQAEEEEDDEIAFCIAVLMAVAFPERISEIFKEEAEAAPDERVSEREREARSFILLPKAVEVLQDHAQQVVAERAQRSQGPIPLPRPRRVEKIGRNEPCPCGSGKKYKKCCAG